MISAVLLAVWLVSTLAGLLYNMSCMLCWQAQVVRQVEMQLQSMRLEHACHTADMEAKLQWCAFALALAPGS